MSSKSTQPQDSLAEVYKAIRKRSDASLLILQLDRTSRDMEDRMLSDGWCDIALVSESNTDYVIYQKAW